MIKVGLRGLLAHKLRLTLTAIAIILGVSFIASTFVVTDTIKSVFGNIFTDATKGVAVIVQGPAPVGGEAFSRFNRDGVPVDLVKTIESVDGVASAYGSVREQDATLLDDNGEPIGGNGPPSVGSNWVDNTAFPYHLTEGTAPTHDTDVVVDSDTSSKFNIHAGKHIGIVFNGGIRQDFTVTGVAKFGSTPSSGLGQTALFTTKTALQFAAKDRKFTNINVVAKDGVDATDLRTRVAKVLPDGAVASTGAEFASDATDQVQGIISNFVGTPLFAFGLISLFVGSFLIVNTLTILITQRTRELALLRALGATRRQVMASVIVEAFALGLVASAAGSVVGVGLAILLTKLLDAIGFALPTGDLTLKPATFLISIGLGTAVTVAASVVPARRATRIAPVAALREAVPEAADISKRRIIAGLVVGVLGMAQLGVALFGNTSQTLLLLGSGALVMFVGLAILVPVIVGPVIGGVGKPLPRLRGVPGRLARENAVRSPRRTASTAAALMIGVALVSTVAVMTASLKASGTAAVSDSILAELLVNSKNQGGGDQGFTPAVADSLAHDKRFADVTEIRFGAATIDKASDFIVGVDARAVGSTIRVTTTSGDARSIDQPNTVLVDDVSAKSHGWTIGSRVAVQFAYQKTVTDLIVGAIYKKNALLSGCVISLTTFEAGGYPKQSDSILLLNPGPGVDSASARSSLGDLLKQYPTLKAQTRQEYTDEFSKQLDQLAGIFTVLLVMSLLIALLGVINTLILSVVERTRELGLLRALGLTRRQVRVMVRWESVLIAFLGAALGLLIGVGLAAAFVRALADAGFGTLSIPIVQLIGFAVITIFFGVVAAYFPARRASRLNVIEAIASE